MERPYEKQYKFDEVKQEINTIRDRITAVRTELNHYFVNKREIIDLMSVCTAAQEPMLVVGKPGTAKTDLVIKFCQALGLKEGEYFEYMLTKFTEPNEIIGPIDIEKMKKGFYLRKIEGKLPLAQIVFLDEIFKSNSAILNTLLTIINERKFYQDGKPVTVPLKMIFAATNEIPEFDELNALKDRFVIKVGSFPVGDTHFEELLEKGIQNDLHKAFNRKPWLNLCSLEDFLKIKFYLDSQMSGLQQSNEINPIDRDRKEFFPQPLFDLFKRILKTLQKEQKIFISDRKIVKLYKLIRTRAFLLHGGNVRKEDLTLLRYIGDRVEDFSFIVEKVDRMIGLDSRTES
ncbi:MAG: AAA family ATPase [Planctomycetota bacterium]